MKAGTRDSAVSVGVSLCPTLERVQGMSNDIQIIWVSKVDLALVFTSGTLSDAEAKHYSQSVLFFQVTSETACRHQTLETINALQVHSS